MSFFTSLTLGALITSALWLSFWPHEEGGIPEVTSKRPQARANRAMSESEFFMLADESLSFQERVTLIERLEQISLSTLKARLEELHQEEPGYLLPISSRLLLAEWGRRDPEGALQWAWDHFKQSHSWDMAWEEIGQEWAWADPERFLQFFRERFRKSSSVTMEAAEKSDQALILEEVLIPMNSGSPSLPSGPLSFIFENTRRILNLSKRCRVTGIFLKLSVLGMASRLIQA